MSSALRRSTRARTGAQRAEHANADSAEHANDEGCALYDLMEVPDYCQVLTDGLDYALLSRFRVSRAMRRWIDPLLELRGVEDADVTAGIQVPLLRLLCSMEHRVVRLARGQYELEGDENNAAHNSATGVGWRPPVWGEDYGPLQIAAGVALVGQAGVVLTGAQCRLAVWAEGIRFDSIGVCMDVREGSLTMEKCTIDMSEKRGMYVSQGTSLVMEDCRIFGSLSRGITCSGEMKLTRCALENNEGVAVRVCNHEVASAELVDCVIRNNGDCGLSVSQGKATLRGGMISGNQGHGVEAERGGKVTVAAAAEDMPQTVSQDNIQSPDRAWRGPSHGWHIAQRRGEIIGIPQDKINV